MWQPAFWCFRRVRRSGFEQVPANSLTDHRLSGRVTKNPALHRKQAHNKVCVLAMTTKFCAALLLATVSQAFSQEADPFLSSRIPPVVIQTVPVAGATQVDATMNEIRVTYSKTMQNQSWSWATWTTETFPEMTGKPRYLEDGRTCVLPVKLQPGRSYALWLNSERFQNFKDTQGIPALPYLLTFRTAPTATARTSPAPEQESPPPPPHSEKLNPEQQEIVAWTDRQFRGFFDTRQFQGWTPEERSRLESRLLDALNGPLNREYYEAINSLAALQSSNAIPRLREIAFDRRDKNNRDRWMAIRSLGLMNVQDAVPELIHLVYHGNINTRWWAQISLVRLTGQNFGGDWQAWGQWWNENNRQPPYHPELIRWWSGQPEPDKLAASLRENDAAFFEKLKANR